MKFFRRSLCLLLCLGLLSVGFSVTAKAEEIEVNPYYIYVQTNFATNAESNSNWLALTFRRNDGNVSKTSKADRINRTTWTINNEYYITAEEKTYFLSGGSTANITIENLKETICLYNDTHDREVSVPSRTSGYVVYTDGSVDYVSTEVVPKSTGAYDVKFTINAKKDVFRICLTTTYEVHNLFSFFSNTICNYTYEIGELVDDKGYNLRIDVQDPNTGLLSGIWDSLTSGFNALGEKLSNVFNAIIELPVKLWEKISDGLISLFVPDEEYMTAYKEQWDLLLADKLGAVYQASQIIFGAWEDIQNADQTDTIALPNVSIPLPEDNEFSFGGYDVQIVPDGFEFLAISVKSIVGIACTLLFINGLRKRYDEVMGGN